MTQKFILVEVDRIHADWDKPIDKKVAIALYQMLRSDGVDLPDCGSYLGYGLFYEPKGNIPLDYHWHIRATCYSELSKGHFQYDYPAREHHWERVLPSILFYTNHGRLDLINELHAARIPHAFRSFSKREVSFLSVASAA